MYAAFFTSAMLIYMTSFHIMFGFKLGLKSPKVVYVSFVSHERHINNSTHKQLHTHTHIHTHTYRNHDERLAPDEWLMYDLEY